MKRVLRSGTFPDGHVVAGHGDAVAGVLELDRRRSPRGGRLPAASASRSRHQIPEPVPGNAITIPGAIEQDYAGKDYGVSDKRVAIERTAGAASDKLPNQRRSRMRRLGLMMLLVAALHGVASAQETTGTITGVTTRPDRRRAAGRDRDGQEHRAPALARTVVTNETGIYTAPLLPIGAYEVTFELSGIPDGHAARTSRCTSTIGCSSTAR